MGSLVEEIEETGSGTRNDRPGWLRVLELARKRKIDCVLVWKLDRAGRSALDLLANIQELQGAGVRFKALTQGIDVRSDGDAMSRLLLTVMAAFAEFERDLISERTHLGLDRARKRGARLGRPPGDRPEPEEVAELREQGLSWPRIAEQLGCSQWAARKAAGAV